MIRKLFFVYAFLFVVGCNATAEQDEAPEGWVKMTFDIDIKGHPQNIVVVDSHPKKIFDKEAVRALKSWKYEPKIIDGTPVIQKDQEVRLDFKLEVES